MKYFLLIFLLISCNALEMVEDEEVNTELFKGNNPCVKNPGATHYDDIGSGTSKDPHWICNAAQLMDLSANCDINNGINTSCSKVYAQGNDIDLDGYAFDPIGDSSYYFNGKYLGYGHSILNMNINQPGLGYLGFVVTLGASGYIQGLDFGDAYINGTTYIGVVAAQSFGGKIEDIRVRATIDASGNRVGGMIGYMSSNSKAHGVEIDITLNQTGGTGTGGIAGELVSGSEIDDCLVTGSLTTDTADLGGVVGTNGGDISQCYTEPILTTTQASAYAGGISGNNFSTAYISQVASSSVIWATLAASSYVGGIVGNLDGAYLDQCMYGGTINGSTTSTYIGGIAGTITGGTGAAIYDCVSYAQIKSSSTSGELGGIVGHAASTTNPNIDAVISFTSFTDYPGTVPGGILGNDSSSGIVITNAYFFGAVEGAPTNANGGISKTNSELLTASTYSGFDPTIWKLVNGDYPQLIYLDID